MLSSLSKPPCGNVSKHHLIIANLEMALQGTVPLSHQLLHWCPPFPSFGNWLSVIWIFYMGIKFRMFEFPKDCYSQVLSFMIFFIILKKGKKLKTHEIKYQWGNCSLEEAGRRESRVRQILLAKLVPRQVMCTNYLSNIMSCFPQIVLLQGAKKVSFIAWASCS